MTAPVGCVATAAAQIMKYYNYPLKCIRFPFLLKRAIIND